MIQQSGIRIVQLQNSPSFVQKKFMSGSKHNILTNHYTPKGQIIYIHRCVLVFPIQVTVNIHTIYTCADRLVHEILFGIIWQKEIEWSVYKQREYNKR
jgi:hypothetical protein